MLLLYKCYEWTMLRCVDIKHESIFQLQNERAIFNDASESYSILKIQDFEVSWKN